MKTKKSKTDAVNIKNLVTKDVLKKFEKSIELIKKYPVKKNLIKQETPIWQVCK